ncbi:MAG: hypothetical protein ACF788_01505 [Novipirellula sp. JB048]
MPLFSMVSSVSPPVLQPEAATVLAELVAALADLSRRWGVLV